MSRRLSTALRDVLPSDKQDNLARVYFSVPQPIALQKLTIRNDDASLPWVSVTGLLTSNTTPLLQFYEVINVKQQLLD